MRRKRMNSRSRSTMSRRGGLSCLYLMLLLVVFCAIASLAVDLGRVQLAKTQLSHSAEAAARAGAAALDNGSAAVKAAAKAIAAANNCDGHSVTVSDSDIDIGTWDPTALTFTLLAAGHPTTDANAVRVKANRNTNVGGQIPLMFASLLGVTGCDIHTTAVAKLTRQLPSQGLIGLDWVRYSSIGVLAQVKGDVASNGNIYIGTPLGLLVSVNGNVQSHGGTVQKGTLASISGDKSPLDDAINCPSVEVPSHNDNDLICNYLNSQNDFCAVVAADIPAGTYVVRDLNLVAGLAVRLEGPVTFYVTRNVNMAVGVNLLGNPWFAPSNFKVRVASGGCVNILGDLLTPVSMDLYAPDADILIAVTVTNFRGRIVGKTVQIGVPALSRFDVRDPPSDTPKITLVQ